MQWLTNWLHNNNTQETHYAQVLLTPNKKSYQHTINIYIQIWAYAADQLYKKTEIQMF